MSSAITECPSPTTEFYTGEFFAARASGAEQSAEVVVPLVLARYPVRSAVDVGCGIGTWLRVLQRHGVSDIRGIDGDYVDRASLQIPVEDFNAFDLTLPVSIDRRFDLALCLEVAEHLPASAATTLVESLTRLSDVILFSAAPPGQGGTNHINERWPDYWAQLFRERDYRPVDCIRPVIWNAGEVDWWCAQNIVLYISQAALQVNPKLGYGELFSQLIHPKSPASSSAALDLIRRGVWAPGVRWCAHALAISAKMSIHRRLRALRH